jgi:hypothetical protein
MRTLVSLIAICSLVSLGFAQDVGWPREKTNQTGTIVYYQPQLDDWKDYRQLIARIAVSVTPKNGKPAVGVVYLRAATDANLTRRNVVLSHLEVTGTNFPSLDQPRAAAMDQMVKTFLPPTAVMDISLDRLLADLDEKKQEAPAATVKNDPPKIFVSYGNAVLLLADGDPVRAPIEKTSLEYVVNSNWDLFFDQTSSKYYLFAETRWLTASALGGPWSVATKLPADFSKLPNQPNWQDVKKAVPPPAGGTGPAPKVFYSTTPAEIITFSGQPWYTKIPNTQLSYAANTQSNLFLWGDSKEYFYLVSGRWFRAKSLDGPWTFATPDLPTDFAKIPASSSRAGVLVSVPGTDQAEDAVLLAQIPTTVIVNRAEAEAAVQVAYDGDPQFKPIESTSLSYASNTQDKVIKVGDLYYLCFQAVWFMSTSPNGPWKTADSIPKEIYTIPSSSPVYNVTYVRQTTTPTGETQASSTAGYLGMFIIGAAVGATVAYGSGYHYPPYFYYGPHPYPIYRPYPITYGVGAVYNPHNGAYGVARGAYGPYGGVAGAAWYNPSTGTGARAVGGCGVYGCGGAARAYNPYTGAYGATHQGSNAYSQWGSSVVTQGDKWAQSAHYSDSRGTVAGARGSEGGRVVGGSGQNGSGFVGQSGSGDIYAGKDGNAYKKTDNGWQQYDNGGWKPVENPAPHSATQTGTQNAGQQSQASRASQSSTATSTARQNPSAATTAAAPKRDAQQGAASAPSAQVQDLNRDAQARQQGTQRTENFQRQSRSTAARPSGGSRRRSRN